MPFQSSSSDRLNQSFPKEFPSGFGAYLLGAGNSFGALIFKNTGVCESTHADA